MNEPVVIEGLSKRFGRLVAVDRLSLLVPAGCVYGFLGLNGAGKTTTIRILLDLLRPTSGRAAILGHDCQSAGLKARRDVGFLPGDMRLPRDLTGRQVLRLFARLSTRPTHHARQQDLLDRFAFTDRDLDRRVSEYSTGMKRKLGIVQAFQADPSVLILDEPTEGLDPLMQEAFYELLAETRQTGRTVFMSSHVLSEVERACDRIAVLRAGQLVLEAPVDGIRGLAPRTVRISFAADVMPPQGPWPAGVEVVSLGPRRWELRATHEIGPLVAMLAGLPVADVETVERKLEDVVIGYYRGES